MLTAHFPRVLCSKMSALVPALATADSGGTRLGGVRGGEKKRQGAELGSSRLFSPGLELRSPSYSPPTTSDVLLSTKTRADQTPGGTRGGGGGWVWAGPEDVASFSPLPQNSFSQFLSFPSTHFFSFADSLQKNGPCELLPRKPGNWNYSNLAV